MQIIDAHFLEMPWPKLRQMAVYLLREGHAVGRERMRWLMAMMGLVPIYQWPPTRVPNPEHRIFRYLSRDMLINQPNHVWCADITYHPTRRGFLCLVAVMDWATRKVPTWHVSNILDTALCV